MWSLKSKARNFLIYSVYPIATFVFREKPYARVISLHDIPEKSQEKFLEKIQWLKSNCNIVSLDDIYNKVRLKPDSLNVALTFDDGFKEHATFVASALRRFSIPATFFIPSGVCDAGENFGKENLRRNGSFKFMSKQEVSLLARDPLFKIGGHTVHHINLGQQLSSNELEHEIVNDKRELEKITDRPIKFFAYPFGSVKDLHVDSIAIIKKTGYKAAFTIVPSFYSFKGDLFRAGRDSLSVEDPIRLWNAWLHGGYDMISWLKNLSSPFRFAFGILRKC